MTTWLLLSSLLFAGGHSALLTVSGGAHPPAEPDAAHKLALAMRCRSETSPLLRLDCYDNALSEITGEKNKQIHAGPAWQQAMKQEKERTDHSTTFLVTEGEGENPEVVLTTPAIGVPPPRPVLMLSCIDNITRLQIALVAPQKDGLLTLTTDNHRFDVQWFLRENGYLLESSRGLAAIDDIKRLMTAQTLTVKGTIGGVPNLTFNISQLAQVLKPLRNACQW